MRTTKSRPVAPMSAENRTCLHFDILSQGLDSISKNIPQGQLASSEEGAAQVRK